MIIKRAARHSSLGWPSPSVSPSPARFRRRRRRPCGTRWPSARAATAGTSTPATATTAACSSRLAPGRRFGGRKYASQAHKATKAEQIAIARRVLAGQGPGAWPTCSRRAGLTKTNGKADKKAVPATNPGATKAKAGKPVVKKAKPAVKGKSVSTIKRVKVIRGDTLAKIAKRYHVKGGWRGLWKLNKKTLKNPNRIYVGQVLRVR